ncbi:glycosyltransferase [Planococcus shenhongbingii]|uniref:glycosyltransferase n=1 Tax=Planococcus shenhongbingii TaxID=3058398 RepID=UPI0026251919|nr:glycosyltransferase [Planococcus sp. N016]WKA57751.1 glycosyltransferase [Planococcus sp. N016]
MTGKMAITLVAVAYNRPESLSRLLASLSRASYLDYSVRLIISIDHGGPDKVKEIADSFDWKFGEKKVIIHEQNLGLRKHILQCGDLTEQYDNIIVLEDDVFVAKNFYLYALSALEFYKDNKKVSGISLYSHKFNETAKLPFSPIKEEHDVFFLQIAASSGQLWTVRHWLDFREWYEKDTKDDGWDKVPENIAGWPKSSWKKYFTKYLIEENKFFVYPYDSLTTNFGDIGQHFWKANSSAQVPLDRVKDHYKFCEIEDTMAVYDAFCENYNLSAHFSNYPDRCTIDLYGTKKNLMIDGFLLSVNNYPYKILRQYGMALKPIEENVYHDIPGDQIFLYDTSQPVKSMGKSKSFIHSQYEYYYPGLDIRKATKLLFNSYTFSILYKFISTKALKSLQGK